MYTRLGAAMKLVDGLASCNSAYRMSGGVDLLTLRYRWEKEALMTDFELLSLVIAIISLVILVLKK